MISAGSCNTPKTRICVRFSYPFFFNLACFWYPKRCTRVHRLVLKNDPNYVNFFTRMISTFKYKCPPPGCYFVELYSVETHLSHTMPPLGFLSGDIWLALVWYWGGSTLLLYTLSLWNKGFTHSHIHLSHHASIGISQWRHFISISVILRGV